MNPAPYSPECVEGLFSEGELPHYGVLGNSRELAYSIDKGGPASSMA
jgi:hypothetical protein